MESDPSVITARSPAKINLFLHVTEKRPDGYHNLRSLMCCVSLYDDICIDFDAMKSSVVCSHADVPADETNLVYRAADRFFAALGKAVPVKITIRKNIPVGAGLGGGSSNAAAVLKCLNRHFQSPFSNEALMKLGGEIGADVPFLIFGQPALATGVGDQLSGPLKLIPYEVVLANPGVHVPTGMVYKKLNLGLTKCEKKTKKFPFKAMPLDAAALLCNDLETVTAALFPEINRIKARLVALGAAGALMSGSGPTVFGLFKGRRTAEDACRSLAQEGVKHLFLTRMLV